MGGKFSACREIAFAVLAMTREMFLMAMVGNDALSSASPNAQNFAPTRFIRHAPLSTDDALHFA